MAAHSHFTCETSMEMESSSIMIARERNGLIRKDDRLSSPTRSIYKSGSIAWGSFEGLATLFVFISPFCFGMLPLRGRGKSRERSPQSAIFWSLHQTTLAPRRRPVESGINTSFQSCGIANYACCAFAKMSTVPASAAARCMVDDNSR